MTRGAPPREVRIVGGLWKRSKLPVADRPGLRPTPDRVRETLFNWLGQDLAGWRVLDAFAGSGALGFEAGSRGAASVTLLERDPALAHRLRETATRLKADPQALRVEPADALRWMRSAPRGSFDLVFIDPPFDAGLHAAAIDAAGPLLAPGGFVYVESAQPLAPPPGLHAHRAARAGAVHFALWRRPVSSPHPVAGDAP